jgi:hypothetical protein
MKTARYCSYGGHPARYDDREAWVLDANGAWYETHPVFVRYRASLTKEAYRKAFGDVPPLPDSAFDPERKLIRYARYDGFPVRLVHEPYA